MQVRHIIDKSKEPCKTIWRLVAETGIRRGEFCGLNVEDVKGNVQVDQRSVTKQRMLKSPKAGVRNGQVRKRLFSLSLGLVEQLKPFIEGRAEDEPLFLTPAFVTKNGKFLAQDLPKLSPDREMASGALTEAIEK